MNNDTYVTPLSGRYASKEMFKIFYLEKALDSAC